MELIQVIHKSESRKEREAQAWKEIVKELASITSPHDIENFLAALITAYERKQITKRAAALPLLRQNKSYREIGKILWLSPATISAVKKAILSKSYVSTYGWNKASKAVKKLQTKQIKTPLPHHRKPGTGKILPHGKLVFPQRRR